MLSVILLCAVAMAADNKAPPTEDGIKIYKRLIPADVLRGRFVRQLSLASSPLPLPLPCGLPWAVATCLTPRFRRC